MRIGMLALLLMLWVSPACSQERIGEVRMFRDRAGEPGEQVTEFRPQDRRMHFLVKLARLKFGNLDFQVRYVGEQTTEGDEIEIARADFGALTAEQIKTHVELPQDWPLGRYRLDVLMNGEVIGRHRYIVSPSWSEQIIGYWALYADRGGEPAGAPIERFPSSQRVLHFEAQTTGYIKRGAQLTFRLLDSDGDEISASDFRIEPDSPVFNILTYRVSLPQDWPAGTYRIEAFSGRRLLGAHEFEIVDR